MTSNSKNFGMLVAMLSRDMKTNQVGKPSLQRKHLDKEAWFFCNFWGPMKQVKLFLYSLLIETFGSLWQNKSIWWNILQYRRSTCPLQFIFAFDVKDAFDLPGRHDENGAHNINWSWLSPVWHDAGQGSLPLQRDDDHTVDGCSDQHMLGIWIFQILSCCATE